MVPALRAVVHNGLSRDGVDVGRAGAARAMVRAAPKARATSRPSTGARASVRASVRAGPTQRFVRIRRPRWAPAYARLTAMPTKLPPRPPNSQAVEPALAKATVWAQDPSWLRRTPAPAEVLPTAPRNLRKLCRASAANWQAQHSARWRRPPSPRPPSARPWNSAPVRATRRARLRPAPAPKGASVKFLPPTPQRPSSPAADPNPPESRPSPPPPAQQRPAPSRQPPVSAGARHAYAERSLPRRLAASPPMWAPTRAPLRLRPARVASPAGAAQPSLAGSTGLDRWKAPPAPASREPGHRLASWRRQPEASVRRRSRLRPLSTVDHRNPVTEPSRPGLRPGATRSRSTLQSATCRPLPRAPHR